MAILTPARLAGSLAVAAVFVLPVAAQGSMQITGLETRGASSVPLTTMSEGVERPGTSEASVGSGRSRGRAEQVPVTVTRQIDAHTPALRSAMAKGVTFPSVTIGFANYEVELSKAQLVSATANVDSGSAMETLVFRS